MTPEGKTKNTSLIAAILRCIFIVILSILLAAIVIAVIIWVFMPETDNGDWKPYTFDKEFAALEAKRAIPDSENAAGIYNRLLRTYNENAIKPNFLDEEADDITGSGPWKSKDYPELAAWIKGHQPTIDILTKLAEIEKCRFPVTVSVFDFLPSLERMSVTKRWAQMLARAAHNDVAEDRIDQAIEKYAAILQMAAHSYQQPTLIEWLVAFAIEQLTLSNINPFLIEYCDTEKDLNMVEIILPAINSTWSDDWPEILDTEKLSTKNECGLLYEINSEGTVRISHLDNPTLRQMRLGPGPSVWQQTITRLKSIRNRLTLPSTPKEAAILVDEKFEKFYDMTKPDFNWKPLHSQGLSISAETFRMVDIMPGVCISEWVYESFHNIYIKQVAHRRGTRILLEIKRHKLEHGQWPISLEAMTGIPDEAMIDPTNGGSFEYRSDGNTFKLYSRGFDNIDQDGVSRHDVDLEAGKSKIISDDIPIWPKKQRKDKQDDDK